MENASKALIIAGSIIISLVIVSLGILVYRRVSGTVTNANLDQQQIEAHNSDYEAYFGEDIQRLDCAAVKAAFEPSVSCRRFFFMGCRKSHSLQV
jgi:hypothetical protein